MRMNEDERKLLADESDVIDANKCYLLFTDHNPWPRALVRKLPALGVVDQRR